MFLPLRPRRAHVAAVVLSVALGVPATAQVRAPAQDCPSELPLILADARRVQALYTEAEGQGQKPEACARALVYVRHMQRAAIAARRTPPGCSPTNPAVAAQYFMREQTIWRAKVQRHCLASTGRRQQQKVIRVTP